MLMDCTGSMDEWIEQASQDLLKVIEEVKKRSSKNSVIRVAYVGYRDFDDIGDRDHFDIMDYTTDLEWAATKIRASVATGGGDQAEDVKGALDIAHSLTHSSPLLLIYHICDEPGHGSRYHEGALDYFEIQPEGYLEESVLKLKNIP
jgi:hypothetical protein